jgi:hypothetical protein
MRIRLKKNLSFEFFLYHFNWNWNNPAVIHVVLENNPNNETEMNLYFKSLKDKE